MANRIGAQSWLVLLSVIGLALGQAGSAGFGSGDPQVPREQRAAYDAAMGKLPADTRGAIASLEGFLDLYPRSLLADDALEQLSQLAFAAGRQETGRRYLGQILADHPRGDRVASARLRLAQLEYGRDKRVAARSLLEPLDLKRLSRTDQRAALRLKATLARTPLERLEALTALRALLVEAGREGTDPASARRLRSRLDSVDAELDTLTRRAATPELEEMLGSLRGRPPAGAMALELSRRALDAGQLDLAERRLRRTGDLVRGELQEAELRVLQERLVRLIEVAQAEAALPPLRELVGRPMPRTEDARGTIGVVLPLSGDFVDYGQESLRGILLAADLFTERKAESDTEAVLPGSPRESVEQALQSRDAPVRHSDIKLVVRDSEGDPAKAAAAVRELAQDPSLVAILGPIFSKESLAAAAAAEEEGVPLVALSTREDLPEERANAFRTRTTPKDEVAVLVDHAFNSLEAERFAVLYPRTRYGRGMRKLYWEAVTARGGKMVAASSYDPEAVDFASAIRNMIGYRFLSSLERRALEERSDLLRASRRLEPEEQALLRASAYEVLGPEGDPLPPIVDFDVLFVPDAAETIALIAPGLAFHEIRDIGLLGPSDWLDDELLRVGRRHVAGAVISSPFYPESDLPFVTEFVEGYRKTFAREPDMYAAEAFDATNLVLVQLSAGREDREGVREGLLDTRAFPGATGVLTMHPNGNARRRPFLLQVSGRRFRPLD